MQPGDATLSVGGVASRPPPLLVAARAGEARRTRKSSAAASVAATRWPSLSGAKSCLLSAIEILDAACEHLDASRVVLHARGELALALALALAPGRREHVDEMDGGPRAPLPSLLLFL